MSSMFIVMNNLCSLSCPVSTLSTLSSSVCQKTHSRIIVYLNDKTNKVVTQRKQQDRMLKHKVYWPWTCCWSHMTKKVGETLGPAANLEKVSTRFPDPCLSGNLAGKRPLDCFWIYLFQAKYIFYTFFPKPARWLGGVRCLEQKPKKKLVGPIGWAASRSCAPAP